MPCKLLLWFGFSPEYPQHTQEACVELCLPWQLVSWRLLLMRELSVYRPAKLESKLRVGDYLFYTFSYLPCSVLSNQLNVNVVFVMSSLISCFSSCLASHCPQVYSALAFLCSFVSLSPVMKEITRPQAVRVGLQSAFIVQ